VVLDAQWSIEDVATTRMVASTETRLEEAGGNDPAVVVDSLNRCVDRLAEAIASALAGAPPARPDARVAPSAQPRAKAPAKRPAPASATSKPDAR